MTESLPLMACTERPLTLTRSGLVATMRLPPMDVSVSVPGRVDPWMFVMIRSPPMLVHEELTAVSYSWLPPQKVAWVA